MNEPRYLIGGASYIPPTPILCSEASFVEQLKEEVLHLKWLTKRTARHEYFMGLKKISYSYGGSVGKETYESKRFTPKVLELMEFLNDCFDTKFNACFLNKYDDQHQHLGWHADDFEGMDQNQPIFVVSLGAEREIWLKDKRGYFCSRCNGTGKEPLSVACPDCHGHLWNSAPPNGKQPDDLRVKLEEGSIFIMPVGFQETHLHRIPKHDRPCAWRISLTFRSFLDNK